ncbi:MAG: hypothetical protein ACWA6R_08165 [Nitrosomonas sp.]
MKKEECNMILIAVTACGALFTIAGMSFKDNTYLDGENFGGILFGIYLYFLDLITSIFYPNPKNL